ncbi:Trm112 family protein [bacterium]|nr:Trm112 family protein [bacterium]
MLDPKLLDILACPRCKGAVEPAADHSSLTCEVCGLRYRVEDGIPIMLVDEAEALVAGADDGSGEDDTNA